MGSEGLRKYSEAQGKQIARGICAPLHLGVHLSGGRGKGARVSPRRHKVCRLTVEKLSIARGATRKKIKDRKGKLGT